MSVKKFFNYIKTIKYSIFIKKIKELLKGNSKYIIRLDDACETMNLENWKKIESILDKLNIKPIVAVIPKNKDRELIIQNKNDGFWELIYSWQKKGWHIALHGYEHKYHKIDRIKQFIPLYDRSEFACLSKNEQKNKIEKGMKIFKSNNIKTNIWVAPSHSFDQITIKIIKDISNIKIISDGIALYPIKKDELIFLPQQLWDLLRFPLGVWTVCLHPNNMTNIEIKNFEKKLKSVFYKDKFINIDSVDQYISNYNIFSFIFNKLFRFKIFLKYKFKNIY